MFVVNLAIALVVALVVWYAASRALAQFIFATETRRPDATGRPVWSAVAVALTFAVFVGSVCVWIGLTYALERLGSR